MFEKIDFPTEYIGTIKPNQIGVITRFGLISATEKDARILFDMELGVPVNNEVFFTSKKVYVMKSYFEYYSRGEVRMNPQKEVFFI